MTICPNCYRQTEEEKHEKNGQIVEKSGIRHGLRILRSMAQKPEKKKESPAPLPAILQLYLDKLVKTYFKPAGTGIARFLIEKFMKTSALFPPSRMNPPS